MHRPNLFVPGFPKSGTSTLYALLCQHPLIDGGTSKEPHTYSSNERYAQRTQVASPYSLVSRYPCDNRYLLDASTSYLISPNAVERILEDTPDAKFIVIARDPVERIFSHFKWLQSKGVRLKVLSRELEIEQLDQWEFKANIKGKFKFFWQFTQYGTQLERLERLVGKTSYHFLFYEDLISDPSKEIGALFYFLGLEPIELLPERVNATQKNVFAPKPLRRLSRYIPADLKLRIKEILHRLQHIEPDMADLELIKPALTQEIDKLESLGIRADKWQKTKEFLNSPAKLDT